MLDELCALLMPMTGARIAGRIGVKPPSLTCYLTARRVPSELKVLVDLYGLARGGGKGGDAPMPFSWEELATAYREAKGERVRTCPICGSPVPPEGGVNGGSGQPTPQKPAASDAPHVDQEEPKGKAVAGPDSPAVDAGMQTGVPVPSGEGDRHPGSEAESAVADVLARHLQGERIADAHVIIRHAGRTSKVEEVAVIIDSCRAVGLDEAAEAVLHHAGMRPLRDVIGLVRLLVETGRYVDANAVLRAAAAD
ncbi:hypothetical protein HS048_01310 [Planomonospora sp. ID91781]|uniref:hypothetical protein n=1 Tax=Planomonospora sp. ID91781 TaxID=2738135 RepID=UPI0018C42D54|nr:hypothetical protein [Planomonospora sp. ID91781]MBG0819403.1 hypothetical protein [Planomonospora sp. ID91781]